MTYEEWKQRWGMSLTPQQEAAVQADQGPVLLLAVPGSGKTTVLVLRLGYLLFCRHVPPESILTVTYTVAATQDMRARFAGFFGQEAAARLEFRTINGLSARIIRYYEQVRGRQAFTLMTNEGKLSALLRELCRQATGEFASESTIKALRTAITYIKNQQLTVAEIEAIQADGLPVARIYRDYCAALHRQGWMDYDDQMVYAARILRQYGEILAEFQKRYPYLCVDEAQDTSKIQHTILRLLAGERRNLFLVGDEDQSIYGFRAADPEALLTFEQTYPGGQVLLMETNYRSVQPIVAAANQFIQQNRARREKHLRAARGEGTPIQELWAYDRADQYARLAQLARTCDRETAILYRNNDSALPLLDLLNRQGIGYQCRQVEGSFFSHRVVRDVTDLIHFAQNPADGVIFLRIYYKLRAGIPKAAAQWAVEQSAGRRPILDLLAHTAGLSPWAQGQCKALSTHFANLRGERGDRALYRIAHYMGYGDYLRERGGDLGKLDILEALGREVPTPADLLVRLDQLNQQMQAGSTDPESKVILSTIHSSKGLEYDRVILMDVADGIFPAMEQPPGERATPEEQAAYEEERRLFYVGMTRARDELMVVRFQKVGLGSAFAEFLFPKPPAKETLTAPHPKPGQRTNSVRRPVPAEDSRVYTPGTRVIHRTFGSGELVTRQGDIVTILLDEGGEKRISLSTALRRQQLKQET